ncbi:MAG TPA: hypothetical protein ENI88_11840 [Desulfobulbus sp.]|nr:hypothetical protein [Desulfobulbus sp.]
MQKPEEVPEAVDNRDSLDTETVRHILKESAEDIRPAHPAVFARIEKSVEESSLADTEQPSPHSPSVQALRSKLRDYFSRPHLAWGVVAVQAVALCLFVAYAPVRSSYQTLSAGRTDIQAPAGPAFYVIFHENARIREIERLLTTTEAVIINGPGKRGIYTIRFSPMPSTTVKELCATLKKSSLITFIEQAY